MKLTNLIRAAVVKAYMAYVSIETKTIIKYARLTGKDDTWIAKKVLRDTSKETADGMLVLAGMHVVSTGMEELMGIDRSEDIMIAIVASGLNGNILSDEHYNVFDRVNDVQVTVGAYIDEWMVVNNKRLSSERFIPRLDTAFFFEYRKMPLKDARVFAITKEEYEAKMKTLDN